MKKCYFLFSLMLLSAGVFAQSTGWMAADSAKNVVKPGSGPFNPVWTVMGQPLTHNGTMYTTQIWGGGNNTQMDYAYFYDFDLNIPSTATINGVEVILKRYGCNGGDHAEDSMKLAFNGNYMGNYVAGMMPDSGATDTVGSPTDTWGNLLTPAIVNDNSFGVFFTTKAFGVCTMVINDLRINVHYTSSTGVEAIASSPVVRIHPNPASSAISLSSAGSYRIADQLGREVLNGSTTAGEQINISSLSPGLYFVRTGEGTAKFMKQ